jgi:hypothetical protein
MPVAPTGYAAPYPARTAVAGNEMGIGVTAGAEVAFTRDGTPSRIAGILLLSAATLAALKLLGFRFNVGVSS